MALTLNDNPDNLDHYFLRVKARELSEKKNILQQIRREIEESNPTACSSQHEARIVRKINQYSEWGYTLSDLGKTRGDIAKQCLCGDRMANPNCAHNCADENGNLLSNPYKNVIRELILDGVLSPDSTKWVRRMESDIFNRDVRATYAAEGGTPASELGKAVEDIQIPTVLELRRVRKLLLGIIDGLLEE